MKRGICRGEVVPLWEWRTGRRLEEAHPAARRGDGYRVIKGNIGKSGNRVFQVPGGRSYDRIRNGTSKGERWFCAEAEARGVGWRRSSR